MPGGFSTAGGQSYEGHGIECCIRDDRWAEYIAKR